MLNSQWVAPIHLFCTRLLHGYHPSQPIPLLYLPASPHKKKKTNHTHPCLPQNSFYVRNATTAKGAIMETLPTFVCRAFHPLPSFNWQISQIMRPRLASIRSRGCHRRHNDTRPSVSRKGAGVRRHLPDSYRVSLLFPVSMLHSTPFFPPFKNFNHLCAFAQSFKI